MSTSLLRSSALACLLASTACATVTTDTGLTGACQLVGTHQSCPSCSGGEVDCSYGGVSVTATSCGDCQARALLYAELCTAGETASAEAIEAGAVCDDRP